MSAPDNIYLNVTINNQVTNPAVMNDIPATYDETLSIPVLKNPNDYYASIIRFTVPTNNIPIFNFPVDVTQNNPNRSAFIIGIDRTGVLYPQNVIYVPQNSIPAPTPAISSPFFSYNDIINPYYGIYNVQTFINMVNTALQAAVTASGIGGTSPFYVYDASNEIISLIVSQTFIASGARIYMNSLLVNYFDGFSFINTSTSFNTGGPNIRFYHDLNPIPYGSPVGGPYEYRAEYTSLSLWFDINKIVITTTSIPVIQEASPSFSPIVSGGNVNSTANYQPIITDFAVVYSTLEEYGSEIEYIPSGQYRLVDMNSNVPITRINLAFYWLSKNGYLYPLYISPNQSASIKLAFLKKDLYKDMKLLK